MYVYGIWRNGTDEPVCRVGMYVLYEDVQNRLLDKAGRREHGEN